MRNIWIVGAISLTLAGCGGEAKGPPLTGDSAKTAMGAYWATFQLATGPCDQALKTVQAVSGADRMTGFNAVKDAENACNAVSMDLMKLKSPNVGTDQQQKDLNEAEDMVSTGYFTRGEALKSLGEGMDTNSVAKLREATDRIQQGNTYVVAGSARMITLSGEMGFDPTPAVEEAAPKKKAHHRK